MSDHEFREEEFDTSFNGSTLLRILRLTRPHMGIVVGFILSIALVAFIEAYTTYLLKRVIDEGILATNAAGETVGDPARVVQILTEYGAIMLVFAFFVFVFIYLAGKLSQQVQYDLRRDLFEHLQELSLSYYTKTPVGWIMSRVTSDSERIADLLSWGLVDVTWAVMNMIAAFIFMASINWQLTLVVLPLIPVLLYVSVWFKGKILVNFRESRRYNSRITGNYNEMITGVRVIKALNRQESSMREFGELTRGMYRSSYQAAWFSALFLPSVQVISALVVGAVIYFGGVQVQNALPLGLTIGGLNAFIGYITFMMWPVQDLARIYASMQHAIASAERTFSLADARPEIVDRDDAVDPGTILGEIAFDHVDFWYLEDDPVLQDFTLRVSPGETIALVGHTGSGKSTIVNLLCRFYEPTRGRILFNGTDYTHLTMHAIQSRIGMVLQTPHLFSGTILDNIRYGRLDASEAEVIEAAKLAGAHEFIKGFTKQYDEQVGEGGVLLSTGQKQLISLARAVLAKPELFIMDEATSSVDTLTEELIQRGMETLMQGRTSIIIAHRLSTIKSADRIIVLDHGKIIEMGSHAELIRAKGHYYNLYTRQFRREAEARYSGEDMPEEEAV